MKFDFLKRKEILKWNKKRFTKFRKCSLLDSQNKLAKMQRTQPLINGLYDKWESKEVSVWKKRFLIIMGSKKLRCLKRHKWIIARTA